MKKAKIFNLTILTAIHLLLLIPVHSNAVSCMADQMDKDSEPYFKDVDNKAVLIGTFEVLEISPPKYLDGIIPKIGVVTIKFKRIKTIKGDGFPEHIHNYAKLGSGKLECGRNSVV